MLVKPKSYILLLQVEISKIVNAQPKTLQKRTSKHYLIPTLTNEYINVWELWQKENNGIILTTSFQRGICDLDYVIETDTFTKGKLSNRKYPEEYTLYAWRWYSWYNKTRAVELLSNSLQCNRNSTRIKIAFKRPGGGTETDLCWHVLGRPRWADFRNVFGQQESA